MLHSVTAVEEAEGTGAEVLKVPAGELERPDPDPLHLIEGDLIAGAAGPAGRPPSCKRSRVAIAAVQVVQLLVEMGQHFCEIRVRSPG
jgi:hypothetical protein